MQVLMDLLREHWAETLFSVFCLVCGAWWGKWRARRQWSAREFKNRINISLNMFRDDLLLIRTILEKDLRDVFLNDHAVAQVLRAAGNTTETDPLLPLSDDDTWYLLNAVLNEISECFALGHVKRDMGADVVSERYLTALTYERAGAMRTHKVRAMVIKKETLLNLPAELPKLESENHRTRFRTLQKLAEEYRVRPGRFLEVEICV